MQACAVIGCGPAGMAAATRLRQSGLLVTCFDLAPGPGGIWLSSSRDVFSSRGLVSPIYPSMRCVLPKDLMSYSDIRFDYTVPQFPHHSAVQYYLERSAERKGVRGLTRFNTKVESVRFDDRDGLWKLITVNVKSGDVMEWSFDKVCVCTGQTQEPRYPPGLKEKLQEYVRNGGELHHSSHVKDFRAFKGKRVVVVGDGVSAYDYCMELKRYGADVHHSTTLSGRAADTKGTLSSILFEEAGKARPAAAQRQDRLRKGFASLFAARADSPSTLEGERVHTDFATTLAVLLHKLPGWRDGTHQANEVIRRWLRYRAAHMEGIPRLGCPVGCAEGRGLVFRTDPTRKVPTAEAVQEARRLRLARRTGGGADADAAAGADEVLLDDVSAVICATGYTHRFPFLHQSLRWLLEEAPPLLENSNASDSTATATVAAATTQASSSAAGRSGVGSRRGLYLGTLLAQRPSLAFIGVQRELLPPFLMFEAQARFVAYAFAQRMPLPATVEELEAKEARLVEANPMLRDLYSAEGLGLHSAAYFNVLEQQLGVSSKDSYASRVMQRRWWVSASSVLRVHHKFRSMAPLKRKKQHILFSNKV